MSEWQPIETAPADGTLILVAYPNGKVRLGSQVAPTVTPKDGYGPFDAYEFASNDWTQPTHWMPLPEPPL